MEQQQQNKWHNHPETQQYQSKLLQTQGRERWEVATGPWRLKPASPGPRERRRRQQAARGRDKENHMHHYWLRGKEQQQGGEGQAEEEEETV